MSRASRALLAAAAILAGFVGACRKPSPVAGPADKAAPPPSAWARKTLSRLTLEEKAAQLIGVRAYGTYRHARTKDARRLRDDVARLKVGCIVVFESEVEALPRLLNDLQSSADVPLLVAADVERGVSMRIRRGVVPLPTAMAFGAAGSEEAARFAGEVTAREARALGIHWGFAPVADVNNNPDNPIINTRSFGEDPQKVADLVAAFLQGARSGGLLTTVKHFPGHGDTAIDSHLQLASIPGDRSRLERVELLPFRRAIETGVDAIMLGHIASLALDPSGAPASLSKPVVTGLLRGEMGYRGLIVTDALDMAGVRAAWTGEAAVRAIGAGADMILLPPEPEVAIAAIVRAVKEGQILESRLDESVLRVLAVKDKAGLAKERIVDIAQVSESVGMPEDVARAEEIARRSITIVRNDRGVLPLHADQPLKILHLVMSSDTRNEAIQGIVEDELAGREIPTDTFTLGPEVSVENAQKILAAVQEHTHVLVSAFVKVMATKGTAAMSVSHARLIERLLIDQRPVVIVSYGSPYLLRQFPQTPAYIAAYGAAESSQRAAVAALFGEYPVGGKLPVTLPGLYDRGQGVVAPRYDMTLARRRPEEAGFAPDAMQAVDAVVDGFLTAKAFPGGVLVVGHDGALVNLRAFGRQTYDARSPAMEPSTLFDIASLTKVVATTTMAMILVDEGRLDINKPVSAFIPAFHGGAKDRVTVANLLTHSSGLDWWAPLYKDTQGQDAFVRRIAAMDLAYEPGTKSLYSDLGLILLGEILERVSGQTLDAFARERIFEPLGMKDTMYRPPRTLLGRIAPTENEPSRGRVVHGEVHDENAFALGGIAPHAGIFSTAEDLSRFAQMLLNGGVYDHHRIVSRATLARFTKRADIPGSSRALGWDTPSENSSAGSLFSAQSFGHTGFTGTSMWLDPTRKLFVILLTNRVHPTRDNNLIRQVRPAVADAVVRGLVNP